MKIKLMFKDPDGVWESVDEAVRESLEGVKDIDADERESLHEERRDKVFAQIEKWVEYKEYVTVEIDTYAKTARVVEKR